MVIGTYYGIALDRCMQLDNGVCSTQLMFTCSAGVGRTGTLITIQSMMRMIEQERKLDIFNFVLGMRCQRNLMVQTEVN